MMSRIPHDPSDHYWIVGGNGNHLAKVGDRFPVHTEVFSSKRDAYVPVTDPVYVKWLKDGWARVGFDLTTRIATEADLMEVLKNAGVPCATDRGHTT